jgi:hypothetical protein
VAGILNTLGVRMGGNLKKANRNNPNGFYEDLGLQKIMLEMWRDRMMPLKEPEVVVGELKEWLKEREGELVGAKHPSLCLSVNMCQEAWGRVKWVAVDRTMEGVHDSWRRTGWGPHNDRARERIIRDHYGIRDRALRSVPPEDVLRVQFEEIRGNAREVVEEMVTWLGWTAVDEVVMEKVVSGIYPKRGRR